MSMYKLCQLWVRGVPSMFAFLERQTSCCVFDSLFLFFPLPILSYTQCLVLLRLMYYYCYTCTLVEHASRSEGKFLLDSVTIRQVSLLVTTDYCALVMSLILHSPSLPPSLPPSPPSLFQLSIIQSLIHFGWKATNLLETKTLAEHINKMLNSKIVEHSIHACIYMYTTIHKLK